MKRIYNQPIVEAVEILSTSLMQAGSPGGITNGGDTSGGDFGGGDPLGD